MSQRSEAIKSYAVPIKAPKDLIDAYLEVKRKALEAVMAHVSHGPSGKARLRLRAEERREIRKELLKNWPYASHYVDSAINSVIGLVKSWIKLHNRGKAKRPPEITRRMVYIKSTLFRVKGNKLIIRIVARRRYLEVGRSVEVRPPAQGLRLHRRPADDGRQALHHVQALCRAEGAQRVVRIRRQRGERDGSQGRGGDHQVRPEGSLPRTQGLRGEAPEDTGAQEDPPEEVQEADGEVQ